eukprot:COSAG04_NODE_2684_length_3741_cov_1.912136_4_plen_79_part_00
MKAHRLAQMKALHANDLSSALNGAMRHVDRSHLWYLRRSSAFNASTLKSGFASHSLALFAALRLAREAAAGLLCLHLL